MNRTKYFDFIEGRLSELAYRIELRGKLNILDYHVHSENFYNHFLNEVFGWSVNNLNNIKQNVEAIDLIDNTNKLLIQVSATASKQKIETSLSKESLKKYADYTFKFVSISKDADKLRNYTYKNPHGIKFIASKDILDIKSILSEIISMPIEDQKRIYEFVKKELVTEIDPIKLETNLALIINILSKENWEKSEPVSEIKSSEIDRKISFNNLNATKLIIDDYKFHYGRLDKIYTEFDSQGVNKSFSVLSTIRQAYIKAKSILDDDKLFLEVIQKVQEKVLNSANYSEIPIDELEICVNILVVDAFIRCKIFENPNNYDYAST